MENNVTNVKPKDVAIRDDVAEKEVKEEPQIAAAIDPVVRSGPLQVSTEPAKQDAPTCSSGRPVRARHAPKHLTGKEYVLGTLKRAKKNNNK